MYRWLRITCCLVVALGVSQGPAGVCRAQAKGEFSLEDVMAGIRARPHLIRSVRVTFTYDTHSDIQDPEIRAQLHADLQLDGIPLYCREAYEFRRKDGKMRVLLSNVIVAPGDTPMKQDFAWDGNKRTGYSTQETGSGTYVGGTISPVRGAPFLAAHWLTPLEQTVLDLPYPLVEMLDQGEWRLSGLERVGDCTAYKIERLPKGNLVALQAWVDPVRDFAPVRYEMRFKMEGVKEIIERMAEVRLEQRDGVWVITEATMKLQNPNCDEAPRAAWHFSAKDYEVGLELPDDLFTVKPPKGTRMFDGILNMSYIVGEGVWVTNSEGLTEFVPTTELGEVDAGADSRAQGSGNQIPTAPSPAYPQASPGSPHPADAGLLAWWPALMMAAVALVGLVAVGIWLMRRAGPKRK